MSNGLGKLTSTVATTSTLTEQNLADAVNSMKGVVGYTSIGIDYGSTTTSDSTLTTTWRNPSWTYYEESLKKLARDYWEWRYDFPKNSWTIRVTDSNEDKGEKKMAISDKLRDLSKDEDQRLLEKHGIVEADGTLTDEGEVVVLERLFATIREGIVADLKKLEESDKKTKKA